MGDQPFISVRMKWHIKGLHSLLVYDVGFGLFISGMTSNMCDILNFN